MFNLDLQAVYLNISGYRFTDIDNVADTLNKIEKFSRELAIKGSIFLASEGINISLAGNILSIHSFQAKLNQDARFAHMRFHQTYSRQLPFNKLVFKVKEELVPLGENPLERATFTHQYLGCRSTPTMVRRR